MAAMAGTTADCTEDHGHGGHGGPGGHESHGGHGGYGHGEAHGHGSRGESRHDGRVNSFSIVREARGVVAVGGGRRGSPRVSGSCEAMRHGPAGGEALRLARAGDARRGRVAGELVEEALGGWPGQRCCQEA